MITVRRVRSTYFYDVPPTQPICVQIPKLFTFFSRSFWPQRCFSFHLPNGPFFPISYRNSKYSTGKLGSMYPARLTNIKHELCSSLIAFTFDFIVPNFVFDINMLKLIKFLTICYDKYTLKNSIFFFCSNRTKRNWPEYECYTLYSIRRPQSFIFICTAILFK